MSLRTRTLLRHISPPSPNVGQPSPVVDGMYYIFQNGCVSIIMNRPKAMNSLSTRNIIFLYECLLQWRFDTTVTHIVLLPSHVIHTSTTKRKGFCAGGDLKEFISTDRMEFTYREYRLDCLIHCYPKPIISLLDGIVMGGGAGIGCLPAFRILTPNSLFSMPEASIGWNTDCGSSFFLSSPRTIPCHPNFQEIKHVGEYLVMSGKRLKTNDLFAINIGTHFLSSTQRCKELLHILQQPIPNKDPFQEISTRLDAHCDDIPAYQNNNSVLLPYAPDIERIFGASCVEEIFSLLEGEKTPWAEETLQTLNKQCPTILKVVFESIRKNSNKKIQECLVTEFRVGLRLMDREDLQEGVASVLIRKDHSPTWKPNSIKDVPDEFIRECFQASPIGVELYNPPIFGILEENHNKERSL